MNSAPPKIHPSNARFAAVVLAAVAAGVAAMVFFFNPSAYPFYPVCQFHRLTGWNCPGCGSTRALYALLHGHLAVAVRDNALLVGGLVLAAARSGWLAVKTRRGRPGGEWFRTRWLWPLLAVMLVFTVLRNLPAFAFLSP